MKNYITTFTILFVILFFVGNKIGYTQEEINNVDFRLVENKIEITYDLVNFQRGALYTIEVTIYDVSERVLETNYLSGDVGENIGGGKNKMVTWDFRKDGILDNLEIYVEVVATPMPVSLDMIAANMSMGEALIMSAAFPGWSNAKLNPGKAQWLKGALGYGSIVAAFLYNQKAASSFEDYRITLNPDRRESFYDQAKQERTISRIFGYTALGIWSIDLTKTVINHNKSRVNTYTHRIKNLKIGPQLQWPSADPVLSLRITF